MVFRTMSLAAAALVAAVLLFSETTPSAALRQVETLLQSRNYDEALRVVSAALAADPRDASLLNARGVVFANMKDPPRARRDFESAIRLDASLAPAWRNLAQLCQSSDPACAERSWLGFLRLNPTDAAARFSLAALYEGQRKYQESIRQLDLLPPHEIGRPGAVVLRCADLAALGRMKDAINAARHAAESKEFVRADAVWLLSRLKSKEEAPLLVVLTEGLASRGAATVEDRRRMVAAYESLGRWKEARAALENLSAEEPRNPDHLFELAHVAYVEHDLEGALGYLGHARDLVPSDARVHFLFGLILVELNLPPEARKSLQKAVDLAPENPDYQYALGSIILRDRDPSPAIDCFRRYLAARPSDPRGEFALGIAYFLTGDYEKSAAQMLQVKDNPATRPGALYFLGRVARVNGQLDAAAEYFNDSIHAQPSFARAYSELARVRMEQGRIDDAKAAVGHALQVEPDNYQANSVLLALYQRTHDPRAAAQRVRLQSLEKQRNQEQELMLRGVEVRPY